LFSSQALSVAKVAVASKTTRAQVPYYALRGKRATEAPGDAPDFPAWHQSSMRLKLRLPFPLGRARRCACTTKFFECVYFFFHGVSKPCNDSNVVVTSLMKGQARNVWRGTKPKHGTIVHYFLLNIIPYLYKQDAISVVAENRKERIETTFENQLRRNNEQ